MAEKGEILTEKTLTKCIDWDLDHPILNEIRVHHEQKVKDIENQIGFKKSHIQELQEQKRMILDHQGTPDYSHRISELNAQLESMKSGGMKKFMKSKILDLEEEIRRLEAQSTLNAKQNTESALMVSEIEANIASDEKSIDNYKKISDSTKEALEESKTSARLYTGVPFSAIRLPEVVMLMLERLSTTRQVQKVEIQCFSSCIAFEMNVGANSEPIISIALNCDDLYKGLPDSDEFTQILDGFYYVFYSQMSKLYDEPEKSSQAMRGQIINAKRMQNIYCAFTEIEDQMKILHGKMEEFASVMNLPEDEKLEEIPDMRPVRPEVKKELYIPDLHALEADQPTSQNQETINDEMMAVVRVEEIPEVDREEHMEFKKPEKVQKRSQRPHPKRQERKISERTENNEDLSYSDFNRTYRQERTANIVQSRKTAREADIVKVGNTKK